MPNVVMCERTMAITSAGRAAMPGERVRNGTVRQLMRHIAAGAVACLCLPVSPATAHAYSAFYRACGHEE
jgi:hypothetical protein